VRSAHRSVIDTKQREDPNAKLANLVSSTFYGLGRVERSRPKLSRRAKRGNHRRCHSCEPATARHIQGERKSLDLDDLDPNSVKFTIAAVKVGKSGESDYQNYILTKVAGREYVYKGQTRKPALAESLQPDLDQGGVLTRARPGVLTYAFKTALPANFDQRATHVVAGEMSMGNRRYVANPVYSFIPAGGKSQTSRSVVETATCNNCHDPLKAHGGARVETAYCALCHTSQLADPETGENLDFKYFIHKVHRGKYLPSVQAGKPYFTVGVRQRVFDYSTIVSPQSAVTESIRKEYRNCAACHANPKVT
jgi:OmcA/MtrC family decaheme c-type cytochrome